MRKQANVTFTGRVQGVWFRAFTAEQARAEGVKGWVRNRPDGSVQAVFQGDEQKVRQVIEMCRQGPPAAHVEKTDIDWESASGDFSDFSIRD